MAYSLLISLLVKPVPARPSHHHGQLPVVPLILTHSQAQVRGQSLCVSKHKSQALWVSLWDNLFTWLGSTKWQPFLPAECVTGVWDGEGLHSLPPTLFREIWLPCLIILFDSDTLQWVISYKQQNLFHNLLACFTQGILFIVLGASNKTPKKKKKKNQICIWLQCI